MANDVESTRKRRRACGDITNSSPTACAWSLTGSGLFWEQLAALRRFLDTLFQNICSHSAVATTLVAVSFTHDCSKVNETERREVMGSIRPLSAVGYDDKEDTMSH